MIKIPQNLKFSQTNTGELSGNIYITKNINFDKEGMISLEKRTRNIFDSTTYPDLAISDSSTVQCFSYNTNLDYIVTLGEKNVHFINMLGSTPYNMQITKDVTAGTPASSGTFDSCTAFIGGNLLTYVVKGSNHLYKYNGTAWTSMTPGVTARFVCLFDNIQKIAVAGDNLVNLVDSSFVLDTTNQLVLPSGFYVQSMDWNNNKLYIGTLNYITLETMMFEWDGFGTSANTSYKVEAQQIMSVAKYKQGVAFVTSRGGLYYANGGVQLLAKLPIYTDVDKQWSLEVSIASYSNQIKPRGITVDEDLIFISLNGQYSAEFRDQTSDKFENNFPSGVWCYDPKVGLYHRYSMSNSSFTRTGAITTVNVNTTTNIITIPSSVCPDTGTPVFYDDGDRGLQTKISPLLFNTRYFVIKLSGTTLKLATTYSNALAGTAIDLTTTGNNAQVLYFYPNSDFGSSYNSPSTLFKLRQTAFYLPPSSFATKALIGGYVQTTYNDAVATVNAIQDLQENRGYFITPRIQSENVKDVFQKLYLKFKPLVNDDDKIIVKYRTTKPSLKLRKRYLNSVGATWVDSTSFTTTLFSEASVGNEIEIIYGKGAGYLAHITNISENAGTYTVTIDETVQNISAGETFAYVVDNWTKLKVLDASSVDNLDGFAEINLDEKKTKWMQFKIELRGIDVTIEELQVITDTFKPSK
jgi:hypothetical protein